MRLRHLKGKAMSLPDDRNAAPCAAHACAAGFPDPELTRRQLILASGGVMAATQLAPAMAAGEPGAQHAGGASVALRLKVNGRPVALDIDPRQSLLDVLRESLELTGTKKGCNQGACGACTVLVGTRRINACLALAAMYDGAEITTVEGLAQGDQLHPLQASFIEHDAFQCGYCTSGQLMSGVACIREGHAASPDEVRAWMSGNICRCGAYPGIVAAIVEVGRRQPS
jgi:xanthine dehydrogenase YagT iron-sulfur-binding subunit